MGVFKEALFALTMLWRSIANVRPRGSRIEKRVAFSAWVKRLFWFGKPSQSMRMTSISIGAARLQRLLAVWKEWPARWSLSISRILATALDRWLVTNPNSSFRCAIDSNIKKRLSTLWTRSMQCPSKSMHCFTSLNLEDLTTVWIVTNVVLLVNTYGFRGLDNPIFWVISSVRCCSYV